MEYSCICFQSARGILDPSFICWAVVATNPSLDVAIKTNDKNRE